jgi:hypothetical protein
MLVDGDPAGRVLTGGGGGSTRFARCSSGGWARYRARDTRLGRDVAIKILPLAFTRDADRLARLIRKRACWRRWIPEHCDDPRVEEGDGARALVLALVEGVTLWIGGPWSSQPRRGARIWPPDRRRAQAAHDAASSTAI